MRVWKKYYYKAGDRWGGSILCNALGTMHESTRQFSVTTTTNNNTSTTTTTDSYITTSTPPLQPSPPASPNTNPIYNPVLHPLTTTLTTPPLKIHARLNSSDTCSSRNLVDERDRIRKLPNSFYLQTGLSLLITSLRYTQPFLSLSFIYIPLWLDLASFSSAFLLHSVNAFLLSSPSFSSSPAAHLLPAASLPTLYI